MPKGLRATKITIFFFSPPHHLRHDICVAPVLTFSQLETHEHTRARNMFLKNEEEVEPRTAPRLSEMSAQKTLAKNPVPGQHTNQILQEYGFSEKEIAMLIAEKVVKQIPPPSRI